MVVVVADQVGLDDLDELLEVLAVGQHGLVAGPDAGEVLGIADLGPLRGVGADAELRLVRVGGEEVDVRQVGRVALAEVGDQFAEAGKRACARLVGDEVGLHGRVVLDLLDERIELGPFGGVVERRRIQQVAGQHGAQLVLGGHVQPLDRRPGQVVAFRGHRGQGLIRRRRRTPEGDEELLLRPPLALEPVRRRLPTSRQIVARTNGTSIHFTFMKVLPPRSFVRRWWA